VIRIGTKGTQTGAFLAGVSGKSISGTTQPVLVNGQGQLGTAAAALTTKAASTSSDTKLRAHVRRQDEEIAALKRQVARLSKG
jgi:hypothetical protein